MRAPTAITFHTGQRVVCVHASPNRRCGLKLLARGKIYIIRAIDQKPGWEAPGWGVHLEGIQITHPDAGCEWPIHPRRFRPVVNRRTNIEIFRKLLAGVPPKEPPQQLRLPLPNPPRIAASIAPGPRLPRTPHSCERPQFSSKLPDGDFLLRADFVAKVIWKRSPNRIPSR